MNIKFCTCFKARTQIAGKNNYANPITSNVMYPAVCLKRLKKYGEMAFLAELPYILDIALLYIVRILPERVKSFPLTLLFQDGFGE